MESTDSNYGETPLVHRLLHPHTVFPLNLFKQKVPRSPFIKRTEKFPKLQFFILTMIALIVPATIFLFLLRYDIVFSYGEVVGKGIRDCIGNCSIPEVMFHSDNRFSVPIHNVTIHRMVNHQISKYTSEIWNYYYGNITNDDFCLSSSIEIALECFRLSFPNNESGTLFFLFEGSPFLRNQTFGRNKIVLIDNQENRFNFVSPMYNDMIYFTADTVTIIGAVIVGVSILVGILISLFFLKGKTMKERLLGIHSLSKDESELAIRNSEIVNSFHGRVILQEEFLPTKKTPEDRALFKNVNGTVHTNEKKGKRERELLSALLNEDEEILSYELVCSSFYGCIREGKVLIVTLIVVLIPLLPVLALVVTGIVIFGTMSLSVFIIGYLFFPLIYLYSIKIPSEAHYILTTKQFIIIERGSHMDMYSINLKDISNIWPRSVVWRGSGLEKYRNELIVKLGEGGEYYNSGVLAINVTNPQYYIETIQELTRNDILQ